MRAEIWAEIWASPHGQYLVLFSPRVKVIKTVLFFFCCCLCFCFFFCLGTMFPPSSIINWQSSTDALNWLIFQDFGPGKAIYGIIFENFKNFRVNDFFRFRSKGGTLLCKDRKFKKVKFVFFQIPSFCLNMNCICSKLKKELKNNL